MSRWNFLSPQNLIHTKQSAPREIQFCFINDQNMMIFVNFQKALGVLLCRPSGLVLAWVMSRHVLGTVWTPNCLWGRVNGM